MLKYILLFIAVSLLAEPTNLSEKIRLNAISEIDTFEDINVSSRMNITIYHQHTNTLQPTIYFVSGGSVDRKSYQHLHRFLALQGYIVIAASSENFSSAQLRDDYFNAFIKGWLTCKDNNLLTDDTRVGLVGHSSGAGILPSLGYRFFNEQNMGTNGRFIFGATPWVDFQHDPNKILPQDVNFATQWFDQDNSTEPNIYLDMYAYIDVNHKTFITVKSTDDFISDHDSIKQEPSANIIEGIYKPLANLADYSFTQLGKENIFSDQVIENSYLKILADRKLPSYQEYQLMMQQFNNGFYTCDTTQQGHSENPRLATCEAFKNQHYINFLAPLYYLLY